MSYRVEFTETAEDDLSKLDRTVARRSLDRLHWLADNAESVRHRALSARFRGTFSLRIGDYRAIYTFDRTDSKVVVHFVRHRSEVYRLR